MDADSQPPDVPLRALAEPDAAFELDATERGRLKPGLDADALVRFLARVPPAWRDGLVGGFRRPTRDTDWHMSDIADPVLQGLLEAVWQPLWDSLPQEALDDTSMDVYPGRQLARERRGLTTVNDRGHG